MTDKIAQQQQRGGMNRRASIDTIIATAAALSGIEVWRMYEGRRTLAVSQARQSAVWMLRNHRGMSYPEIACALGMSQSAAIGAYARVHDEVCNGDAH